MAQFFTLLLLCVIMGAASFCAGLAPLVLDLSQRRIRLISSFGIGILVGTALIVIIPEGVEALYSASTDDSGHKSIGIALILGFILMYLIDRLPELSNRSMPKFMSVAIDMSNLRFSNARGDDPQQQQQQHQQKQALSTVIGLVIHSIADGIALGASVSSENSALEAIVFLAIMVHKAPASFGFTAILLRDNVPTRQLKRALAVFASGAPVGALATFLVIKLLGSSDSQLIQQWTGLLLLFSGGTFLFVAVHAMQDLHEADHNDPGSLPQDSTGVDIGLSAAGMLVPLITLLVPDVD